MIAMLMLLLSQAPKDIPVTPPPSVCVEDARIRVFGPDKRSETLTCCCPGPISKDCCRAWCESDKPERPACAVPQS